MSSSLLSQAIKIFFSYAVSSPKDTRLFTQLTKHLSTLRHQNLISEWYDSAITAGSNVAQVIEAHLRAADIIILLISAEFLADKRCYEFEMMRALELSETGAVHLIPVLLYDTDWETLPLRRYKPLPADGIPINRKRDKDQAFSEIAREIRHIIEHLAGQARRMLAGTSPVPSPLYYLPQRENSFFTDREPILATLSASFSFTQIPRTSVLALHGLGGIGKTQIALAYLYRSLHLYHTVLWLNASSREVLGSEISEIAYQLALSPKEREDESALFAAVKRWLQDQTGWLLVLDHIDDITLVDLLVPLQSHGHVLLTTRTLVMEEIASSLLVTPMDAEASTLFLLQRAGVLPLHESINQAPPGMVNQATAIAQAMDGFPLALDQAGAYLEETGCGLATYLELFQKRQEQAALLHRRGRFLKGQGHPDSVAITLALTFEKVKAQHPTSLHLLRLFAFLYPEAIPYELLVDGASVLREPLRSLAMRPLALNEALADLHNYALIHHLADTTTLSIHRLVQAVLINHLTTRQQRQWASQIVRLVNHVFPEAVFNNWTECQRFLPQARHCAALIKDYQLTLPEGALLLQRLGSYCHRQANDMEAETHLMQALVLHEQHQWDLLETAQTLNSLALVRYRQARYQEAESFHLRALALREQALGSDHPTTAESLHNLAMLYGRQGNYQQAEHLYHRVLAIEERANGAGHPEMAKTLNNLGLIYYEQGNYPQAEIAYQQALALIERSSLIHSPDLMYALDGLGALAEKRGLYQQAEEFYHRAFVHGEQTLGDAHPETAHCLNKLADIYETQGKDQQAETLYRRALTVYEQTFGSEHPDTALLLNNIAYLAEKQGNYQQAEDYYQRALSINEHTFGEEHTSVADILNNLGVHYRDTHDLERAEPLLRRALAIRQHALPSSHPDRAQSMSNLAILLTAQQAYEEAESLFRQALALRLQAFDPRHPTVLHTQEHYASLLEHMNKHDEAALLRKNRSEPENNPQESNSSK